MGELGYSITGPSLLRMDNQLAIAVSKNPEHHSKMKHLSLHLFWLRDAVQDGLITPKAEEVRNQHPLSKPFNIHHHLAYSSYTTPVFGILFY